MKVIRHEPGYSVFEIDSTQWVSVAWDRCGDARPLVVLQHLEHHVGVSKRFLRSVVQHNGVLSITLSTNATNEAVAVVERVAASACLLFRANWKVVVKKFTEREVHIQGRKGA